MGADYELIAPILAYEPESGSFFWRADRRMGRTGKGHLVATAGDQAGGISTDSGYVQIRVVKKKRFGHRLAFLLMTGKWPSGQVDHINGNRADNRWANLRDVPQKVNAQNLRAVRPDSKTGVMGVQLHAQKGKYVARIRVDGKTKCLGYYQTTSAASDAYLTAKRLLHEGCTI